LVPVICQFVIHRFAGSICAVPMTAPAAAVPLSDGGGSGSS
jgi:hypothetical protein